MFSVKSDKKFFLVTKIINDEHSNEILTKTVYNIYIYIL